MEATIRILGFSHTTDARIHDVKGLLMVGSPRRHINNRVNRINLVKRLVNDRRTSEKRS